MDPLSITSGALGTFGVVLQSAQALIQLIGDVRDAPEEIGAASKEVESFTGVLKNIQDQVDNGTIPKEIAETLKLPLSNCTSEITNLTNKLRPYITGSGSGRKWTNRLKWAMVEKQFVKGVAERLSQNKLTLLTGISGYTVANTGKQLGELNSQISKLEDASLDRHKAEIGNTKYIADGVRELDNRVIMVSEETKERDMRLAAEAKAHSEQLAAAMAAQLEAQMSALLATQFAKLEQNFVGANAPQNTQEEQIVASKTDQIRDLIVKVKDDPVFALRNFFEGSTVIEGNTAKASDIADLATLEDDYMIDDEADDVGNSGLSIEERIESYGGWAHPTESLFSAVMAGDKQVVVALLEAGVDVDAINKNGKTALMLAADDDQKLIARKLLEKGANIDSADADGSTALHMACNRGYVTICVLFLRNGADIEAKNLKLETPLQIAVLANRPHIVQSLVEQNCDLKAIGPAGFSILHLIIEKGYLGMQRILLDGGANVDIRDPTTGRTPLQIASLLGKSSFVTMLLEHGASPNLVDDKLDTAFLVAAREGKQDILKLLANGGADVNMKSAKGNSALHEAAGRLRSEEVIETLLELPNLEINQKNSDHLTPFLTAITVTNIPALKLLMKVSDTSATNEQKFGPLHLAAQKSTLEVVQILIEHGLDLYALDIYKMPPFHRAVRCSNVPVLEHFLKLGADVNAISGDAPWTSLHHACHSANVATVKSLLSHGAKTETIVPNDVSATAFLRAVRNGKLDIVRFLLDNGANIAPETHLGYTALHLCAWKSQPKICSLLLERGGIDIEARDNQGMTPLLRAANTPGSEEVALLLIKKGANREAKANTDENALRLFLRSNGKSVELFNALLEKEVDISAVDNYKLSPLIRAVVSGQLSIVSAILAKNPNLESTNSSQMTSLNIAAWKGFKEIVVLLLNAGANINHRDINGISSLIHAAKCGQEEIVTLLIARGADVYAKNNKAQNTLDVAIEAKKTTLAAMLMNMEAFQKSSSTIQQAVEDNNVPLIELLLMKKPELIEEKDQYGYTPLHLSLLDPAKNAAFTFLLEKGSDLEGRITSGETPLMISAWKNHKDGALKLIEKSKFQSGGKCPLIFQTGTKGWTPLHYATRWNTDTYIIKLLLSNGAEVDAVDENEVTALHQAADQGRLEAIRILVAAGANIDAKDKWGQTPIMRAIKGKHISTSQLFVELGASVQEKTYQYSMSALLFAVSWTDSVPLVETLLTAGATINDDLDNEECNPLTRAAVTGNRAVFEFLLTKGGRPDAIDVFGQQPLQRATRITSEKGVRILLDAGADVNFKEEKWGMTALHYAASTNSTSEIAQLLLDHGADINSKDVSGTTPIFKAAFQAKIVLLKFLVEKGADLEARNNEGLTPLLQMVKSGRRDMVSLLLEQGADITAKESKLGLSIAHIAAVSNSQALIMEDLLKRGVPLEGKDNNGNTPLLRAAIAGREAVIRCLLAKGANLEALNTVSPLTPVLHAICNRQVAAALFLLKHGVNHNATNNTGWHGVHMAASNGVALALNFYIEHGYTELEISDASPASSRGLRALHIAVREGHDECVKILLASGAGVEFKTFSNKYTPFLFVAEPRYTTPQKTTSTMLAIAKKLVAAKADIFVKDRNGRNALFGASRLGAIELMEFLVEKGLQLDVKDLSDNTLIHVTTENDQKKTLEYLIKNGVDVCVSNNKGITPLHIAVSKYNCAIVKILVGANANAVDMNDKAGKTPFDEAVRLAAQYDGPEELRPKTTAIPQMSREKARQNIKDIVALFHNIRGTKDIAPIITTISRRATEPIIRGL